MHSELSKMIDNLLQVQESQSIYHENESVTVKNDEQLKLDSILVKKSILTICNNLNTNLGELVKLKKSIITSDLMEMNLQYFKQQSEISKSLNNTRKELNAFLTELDIVGNLLKDCL